MSTAGPSGYQLIAAVISVAALFSYFNYRFLRLPTTLGVMLIGMLVSVGLLLLRALGLPLADQVAAMIAAVDFEATLMQGMLSFLLFAGALHVNLADLAEQKWVIGLLATVGVLTSTWLVGSGLWLLLPLFDLSLPYIYCLLFGALISPTDPIAVLALLKSAGVSKSLETKIAGESLFNDGVGVVVFMVLLGMASAGAEISASGIFLLFAEEVFGGALFGLVAGFVVYRMLASVDNYQVEVLLTLGLVTGGYALASHWHLSGPIAIVVAGLLVGNHGRRLAMSDLTRSHLDSFWELIDEILNVVLFLLLGIELLVLQLVPGWLPLALLTILLVLSSRFLSISVPLFGLRRLRSFSPGVLPILTWGGLRGGISVALALSLPASDGRGLLLTLTYAVVVFSIFVQGLTVGRLANHYARSGDVRSNFANKT